MQNGSTRARRIPAGTLGGLLAALALTGCSNNTPATPPNSTVVTTNPAPAAGTTTTTSATPGATTTTTASPGGPDTKINTNAGPGTSNGTDTATEEAVNTAIVHNKQMTGSRVEVVVTGGVARLTGTVQDQQQKALAGKTASQTPGVNSVVNKLDVVATGGAHSAAAKPKTIVKVFNHTTVVHDQAPPPPPATSDDGGGSQDNSGGNGAGGNGAGASGDNGANGSGDNSGSSNSTSTPGSNP